MVTRHTSQVIKSPRMKSELIFPMATYVLFMWIATVHMFRTRVSAIKGGQVHPKYYKAQLGEPPSEKVVLVGRHYDNQFQVPLLFLITCAVFIELGQANQLTVLLAWLFVVSRGIHSWILLGRNVLQRRVAAFALGWLIILALWIQLVYVAIQGV